MKLYYKTLFLCTVLSMTHNAANAMLGRSEKFGMEIFGEAAARTRLTPVISVMTDSVRDFHSTRLTKIPYGATGNHFQPTKESEKKNVPTVALVLQNLEAQKRELALYSEITKRTQDVRAIDEIPEAAFNCGGLAGC